MLRSMTDLIAEIADPLKKLVMKDLDDQNLYHLSQCSSQLFELSKYERLLRLAQRARNGDIQAIKVALLNALKNAEKTDSLRMLLTSKIEMIYTDETNDEIMHHDTLLQLAWRMRNIRLFDIIKSHCDKIDPKLAASQILHDFQGEQSCWLKKYAEKLYRAGMLSASSELINGINPVSVAEAEQFWQQEVGQIAIRLYQDMSWVIHLQCNKILSRSLSSEYDFDDAFDIGQAEIAKTKGFIYQQFNGGLLGSTWAPTEDIQGKSIPSKIYILEYWEYAEWSGNIISCLSDKVSTAEKSRLLVMQKELLIEDQNKPGFDFCGPSI